MQPQENPARVLQGLHGNSTEGFLQKNLCCLECIPCKQVIPFGFAQQCTSQCRFCTIQFVCVQNGNSAAELLYIASYSDLVTGKKKVAGRVTW